jgi:uncharacterized protein with beta-barrel porin domain
MPGRTPSRYGFVRLNGRLAARGVWFFFCLLAVVCAVPARGETVANVTETSGILAGTLPRAMEIMANNSGGTVSFRPEVGNKTISASGYGLGIWYPTLFANDTGGTTTIDYGSNYGGTPLSFDFTTGSLSIDAGIAVRCSFGPDVIMFDELMYPASLAYSATSLNMGTIAGSLSTTNGTDTNATLSSIYSKNNLSIDTISGSVSTSTDTALIAYGVYSGGSASIGSLSGGVSAANTSGNATGVAVAGNLTIGTLSGSISADAASTSSHASYGIHSGSGTVHITESTGTITASSHETACGIVAYQGNVTIGTLGGSISATANAGTSAFVGTAAGITGNSVDITNYSGTITTLVTGGSPVNSLSIGISAVGGSMTIGQLDGNITATSTTSQAFGLYSTGAINGGSASTPMVVSGTVAASGRSASGIIGNGVNLQVTSQGSLSATATGIGPAYAIYAYGGPATMNQVELVAGCHVVGDIYLDSAGSDTLTLSGSTGSTTLNNNLTADNINITGGHWNLNGNIAGDLTPHITAGTLSFNSTTTGTVTVDPLAVMGGTGTIGGLLNNGGSVSPGNSIGILHVTGDYTHAAGSTLAIEIDNTGRHDLLLVGGSASIQGGTVSVTAGSGTYVGNSYTFLEAHDGVSGHFDGLAWNLPFLTMSLVYGSDYVALLVSGGQSYDTEAVTLNQHGVARYLDAHGSGASGDFSTVLDQLNLLSGPQARTAFDAMSGEIFGSLATVGIENNDRFLRTIAQHLQSQSLLQGLDFSTADARGKGNLVYVSRDLSYMTTLSGWTPWMEGFGVGASLASNGNAGRLGYSTGGFALGMEKLYGFDTRVGLAGGYTNSHVFDTGPADTGTIDGGQLGAYLYHDFDSVYFTGVAAYGYNSYSTYRQIAFGTIDRTAHAGYGGSNVSFYTEIGQTVYARSLNWQPYAALEYIQLHQNEFIESGANSINISAGGIGADAFRGLLGTRLVGVYHTDSGRLLSLEGRAAWRHEFLNEERIFDAMFVGQPGGAFTIAGVNVDRDVAVLGTGLTCRLCSGFSLYAGYDALVSQNYTAHAGSGGLQYLW